MRTRIKNIFPYLLTGAGLFEYMDSAPWYDLNISETLNQMFASHSNNKKVSPFVYDLLADDTTMSETKTRVLARMLTVKYNDKWGRLWALGEVEYNPLSAGTLTEHEELTETRDRDDSDTGTASVTDAGTVQSTGSSSDTGTVGTQRSTTEGGTVSTAETAEKSIYGLNSSAAVPADETDTTGTETRNLTGSDNATETRNLTGSASNTETRNLTNTRTQNLAHTEDETTEHTRDLTRNTTSGNVQELITAERMLWSWNFWDEVFHDVDELLCIDVY